MLWCWEMKPQHRPLAEELLGVLQNIQADMTPGEFLTLVGGECLGIVYDHIFYICGGLVLIKF